MRTPRGFDPMRLPRVLSAGLPEGPDALGAWINLDLLTRRVVGRRLEQGPTFGDERGARRAPGAAAVDGAAVGELNGGT